MADTYNYIFEYTLSLIRTVRGVYGCYAESDFVYDLGSDNENIKKSVMPHIENLLNEILRGTMRGAFNQAVKLAKENNLDEIDKLFADGHYFFYTCFIDEDILEIKNHIKNKREVPYIDYDNVCVHLE